MAKEKENANTQADAQAVEPVVTLAEFNQLKNKVTDLESICKMQAETIRAHGAAIERLSDIPAAPTPAKPVATRASRVKTVTCRVLQKLQLNGKEPTIGEEITLPMTTARPLLKARVLELVQS